MSFAGERKAYLQAIVDAHYPTTRPSTDFSSCTTLSQLQQALQSIPSELQGSSSNPQDDANAAVQLIGLALRDLLQQGLLLQSEIDYWAQIEDHTSDQSAYLLQTAPKRLYRLVLAVLDRLRHLPRELLSPSGSRYSFTALKNAIPPPTSVLAVLFPHLSEYDAAQQDLPSPETLNTLSTAQKPFSRKERASSVGPSSNILRTFAPGFLARQEARIKRKALERQLKQVVSQLGAIASTSQSALPEVLSPDSSTSLDMTFAAMASSSSGSGPEPQGVTSSQSGLLQLITTLKIGRQTTEKSLQTNARPTFWEQVWPKAAVYPLLFVVVARQVHKNKDAIWLALQDAKETVKGFVLGWVVEPVTNIINTVRGKGGLALTGEQSLASDLDSLERMVLDFDREVYKMNDAQLARVSSKLRDGDLSEVLQAWETDIKTPFRSMIRGTLIRTLLIQIQKVKVDVDLAMSGIQAMLQSQQLTFAFVGVAPSLLILFGAYRWLQNTFSIGAAPSSSRAQKAARRRVWLALRSIDMLLSSEESGENDARASDGTTTQLGYLLLELQALRDFASSSRQFPSRDKVLRKEFLKDVSVLESSASDRVKLRAVDRVWRSFGFLTQP